MQAVLNILKGYVLQIVNVIEFYFENLLLIGILWNILRVTSLVYTFSRVHIYIKEIQVPSGIFLGTPQRGICDIHVTVLDHAIDIGKKHDFFDFCCIFVFEVLTVLNGGLGWLHQVSLCHVHLGR